LLARLGRGLLGRPAGGAGWAKVLAGWAERRRGERAGGAGWLGLLAPVGPRERDGGLWRNKREKDFSFY